MPEDLDTERGTTARQKRRKPQGQAVFLQVNASRKRLIEKGILAVGVEPLARDIGVTPGTVSTGISGTRKACTGRCCAVG